MSGEFGKYDYRGYIDNVIRQIADECLHPDEEYRLTRMFGEFLKSVSLVAQEIALLEAGDNGEFSAARNINAHMPRVRVTLDRFYEQVEKDLQGGNS